MNYKYPTSQLLFKAMCDAIREKTGSNNKIAHQDIPDELDNIMTGEEYLAKTQELYDIINDDHMDMFNSEIITNVPAHRFFNADISSLNLPKCTSIGDRAFYNSKLVVIDLPKCTSIGTFAFGCCINLTTVNLPKCTSIGNRAFSLEAWGNSNLTTVNLPKCASIGENAFMSNAGIEQLILANSGVCTLVDGLGCNIRGSIYVPDNLVSSYKTANNWSTHANQIKPISELPDNLKEEYGYD